ncbi:MAG: asparagine synthetase B, partial [candidate division WOR-3 bacterium]
MRVSHSGFRALSAIVAVAGGLGLTTVVSAQRLLVPMDLSQTDHLKAYGIAYHALVRGINVEWLLNYRAGSFLMNLDPGIETECRARGVRYEFISPAQEIEIRKTIENSNMDAMMLEKAPKVGVYAPPNREPWDDAVRLALDYAEIPYEVVWDQEVLEGKLSQFDWLHLHHEDFTGQYGKFFGNYRNADWYRADVTLSEQTARALGFAKVSQLKLAVIKAIKRYVENGGMMFAMCSATDTPDIALAAEGTDICESVFDGDGVDPGFASKLNYDSGFAFESYHVITDPMVYEHSDIDTYQEAMARGRDVYFQLFDFSAKYDPVPTMLVQDHTSLVKEFLGQNCGFRRSRLKKKTLILGEVAGTEEVKYIHGNIGKGTFTFLGGHDPEDFEHRIGDPPTNLEL